MIRRPVENKRKVHGINLAAFSIFCKELNNNPPIRGKTREELAEIVGINQGTSGKWLRFLELQELVYIIYWRKRPTGYTAEWAWGYKQTSELKPKPKPGYISSREWEARKIKEAEKKGLVWNRTLRKIMPQAPLTGQHKL